jgi:hypothetical protein
LLNENAPEFEQGVAMRVLAVATILLLAAACSNEPTQPSQPMPNALVAQPPVGSSASGTSTGVTSSDIEAQRLAQARNLNLKVVSKDGQQLFCRSNYMTGSHIQRDTRCYTADQLDAMEQATQRDLDTFMNRSDALKPAALPSAK